MITPTQKQGAASHTVSAVSDTTVSHVDLSVVSATVAVDQVKSDMAGQWQQSLIDSSLPKTGDTHAGQGAVLRGADDAGKGGADPSKGGDSASQPVAITGPADILRNAVLADIDPATSHDPTKHDDINAAGSLPSRADLAAMLGSNAASAATDLRGEMADQTKDPRDHANGQSEIDSHKGQQSSEEGMVGAVKDLKVETYDFVDPKGDVHHVVYMEDKDRSTFVDVDRKTGWTDVIESDKNGTKQTIVDPDKGTTTVVTDDKHHTSTKTNPDGSSTTTDTKTGKVIDQTPALAPITDDHKSDGKDSGHKTGGAGIPDEDQPAVDAGFNKLMENATKDQHSASHGGDNRDPVDTDIPGMVSSADLKGGVIADKAQLISTPGSPDLADGGHGGGPGPRSTAGDTGHNLDQLTQGTGPEERGAQPAVKTGAIGSHPAGGQQNDGNGNDQNGGDSHQVSQVAQPVNAVLQHETQGLTATGAHADGGTQTAQSVEGVHAGSDVASVLGGTSFGGIGGAGGHDTSAFADLVRLAQNPVQSGLAPQVSHDALASLQLSVIGDFAGHSGGDTHHVDDTHAAVSIAVPADLHVDHSHLAAPAADHGHAVH